MNGTELMGEGCVSLMMLGIIEGVLGTVPMSARHIEFKE